MNLKRVIHRMRISHKIILCSIFFIFITDSIMADDFCISDNSSVVVQGGWNYDKWLQEARQFAEKIIKCAPDTYGEIETPLWLSVIDPITCSMIINKPPNWQTYWDAEDYVMIAQGCNLYRDLPTLAAFYELSCITNDPHFSSAAEAYHVHLRLVVVHGRGVCDEDNLRALTAEGFMLVPVI